MKIIRSVHVLRRWRRQLREEGALLGFVPTMGAFHAGHQSLMKRARRSCASVAVSIFVNPLQFGPTEDLDQYPRPRQADIAICQDEGVDAVFIPTRQDLYPSEFQTSVTVSQLATCWEGAQRSTHFQGVTTVVAKLFNMVKPHRAFFGQKDYQQLCVVRQMSSDLNYDVRIMSCPTVRERDGLALSSRNIYLSERARKRAPRLYQALQIGKAAIQKGEKFAPRIEKLMRREVAKEPNMKIDYLAVCHADSLETMKLVKGKAVLLGAVRLENVRLIDNLTVRSPS